MTTLPKLNYRLNIIPVRIPADFFVLIEIDKVILKFIWNYKGYRIAKTLLKKNEV